MYDHEPAAVLCGLMMLNLHNVYRQKEELQCTKHHHENSVNESDYIDYTLSEHVDK
jgi:predicted Zn-dependent protease